MNTAETFARIICNDDLIVLNFETETVIGESDVVDTNLYFKWEAVIFGAKVINVKLQQILTVTSVLVIRWNSRFKSHLVEAFLTGGTDLSMFRYSIPLDGKKDRWKDDQSSSNIMTRRWCLAFSYEWVS